MNGITHCITDESAELTFGSVTQSDAGSYYCKVTVEIPSLRRGQSEAAVLSIRGNNRKSKGDKFNKTDKIFNKEGAIQNITISQFPLSVTAVEGESVEIHCSWEGIEEAGQMKVEWGKDERTILTSFKEQMILFRSRVNYCKKATSATMTIHKLTKQDAGTYYCRTRRGQGGGTVLLQGGGTVLSVHGKTQKSEDVSDTASVYELTAIVYLLRSLPFLALLAAIFYLTRGKKKTSAAYQMEVSSQSFTNHEENESATVDPTSE
ncbi:hypothetical protein AOXY_G2930 [Acipenser oxyrinchus oxyrinchus]|uniref:Ig-like domain-containing protein n=1 Tax=Acipenser oxyrinchus oxyrinchus TaxID=40147 RepID=A0AAD8GJC3_ACIOX|nr:hypothetical protein AOXY_G2930 [Acipenser oxyrinchus oxyrinchus]